MAGTLQESEAVLTVSQDPSIVTVIERFAVPHDGKDDACAAAGDHISRTWVHDPAFVGAAAFRGRDHDGISILSQWKRLGGAVSPDSPPPEHSMSAALSQYPTVESRVFSLDFIDDVRPDASSMQISMAVTKHAHYGLFSVRPEDQNRVIDLGRGNSGQALGIEGLLNINWYRSIDGQMIINLGTWTTMKGLVDLEQQPGFQLGTDDVYWNGYADWTAEQFDVVAVVAGPANRM